jgi:hypothetical protein
MRDREDRLDREMLAPLRSVTPVAEDPSFVLGLPK